MAAFVEHLTVCSNCKQPTKISAGNSIDSLTVRSLIVQVLLINKAAQQTTIDPAEDRI